VFPAKRLKHVKKLDKKVLVPDTPQLFSVFTVYGVFGSVSRGCSVKILNGHISATDHPIDFVFDPRVGFSGTADRMDLLLVGPNQ